MKFVPTKKHIIAGISTLALLVTASSAILNVNSGEYVRYQKPSGDYEWFTSPGYKFVMPFVSTIETYNETSTISFSFSEDTREAASLGEAPFMTKFADGYWGKGEYTFRFKLSPDPDQLEKMHIAVKNQRNLLGNTMLPAATALLNQTANQFTGADYAQGGKGQFESRLIDQARNGLLSVKRVRKEVDSVVADQGKDERAMNQTAKVYEYVFETQLDSKGMPLRRQLDIKEFGIKFAQVTMGSFNESPELEQFLADRRKMQKDRVNRINEQNVERENAITESLRGETKRIQAKNKALMVKDAAVIAEQQKVAIEREKANLSIVQKEKELKIAQSNEAIQKANAVAAKYEAQAILEKGQAEAKVTAAKYKALGDNKDIYLAEIQRDISRDLYRNLRDFKVQMPTNYINGGGENSGMQSNLDVITGFGALGMMEKSINGVK